MTSDQSQTISNGSAFLLQLESNEHIHARYLKHKLLISDFGTLTQTKLQLGITEITMQKKGHRFRSTKHFTQTVYTPAQMLWIHYQTHNLLEIIAPFKVKA
jgi:hypothetical protein